jgi:hydroxymethylglutaryl-CoA lyase
MKILETFRDGLQGLERYITPEEKIRLLNAYIEVGFDILDVGSLVSPKTIPQFRDMETVLNSISKPENNTRLMVMVANQKGMEKALRFPQIDFVIYPFSPSEIFLQRNINQTIDKSLKIIDHIHNQCNKHKKELWIYYAMAFGSPYDERINEDTIWEMTDRIYREEILYQSFADTIGVATETMVNNVFHFLKNDFPKINTGLHLHSKANEWKPLVKAAWENGCDYFDGVLSGLGGCPMTGYELKSNLSTSLLLDFAKENNVKLQLDEKKFREAKTLSDRILFRNQFIQTDFIKK